MENSISLFDLNLRIKEVIKGSLQDLYWVVAEISEMKVNSAGHCYLELVDKDPDSLHIKARARATIWAYTYRMLKPYFESATRQKLDAGIKIMAKCSVEFHEVYGLSLNIQDIDPAYTVGELARKREEIIHRLEQEGVLSMNQELPLPPVLQKIAVISSATAAGFEDFIRQLELNDYRFKYYYKLFPATMQGSEAEHSIINALDRVHVYEHFFDVVAIIRGGGSQADLSCFDNYQLAYYITQFPLPVITGIGHEKDESVTDIVAHTPLKTPTAVADFIIQQSIVFFARLLEIQNKTMKLTGIEVQKRGMHLDNIANSIALKSKHLLANRQHVLNKASEKCMLIGKNYLKRKQEDLKNTNTRIIRAVKQMISYRFVDLKNLIRSIQPQVKNGIRFQKNRLNTIEKTTQFLNPGNVLKRGYSITSLNGQVIKKSSDLSPGDVIKTTYFSGKSTSTVEKTE